jgi:hypothetical protein
MLRVRSTLYKAMAYTILLVSITFFALEDSAYWLRALCSICTNSGPFSPVNKYNFVGTSKILLAIFQYMDLK